MSFLTQASSLIQTSLYFPNLSFLRTLSIQWLEMEVKYYLVCQIQMKMCQTEPAVVLWGKKTSTTAWTFRLPTSTLRVKVCSFNQAMTNIYFATLLILHAWRKVFQDGLLKTVALKSLKSYKHTDCIILRLLKNCLKKDTTFGQFLAPGTASVSSHSSITQVSRKCRKLSG